ncbi:MAG: hypothetical protein CME36_09335 [unclassified Hahellaceae]|nr:hypothetical protein [Hahellaceae bacterium]|tara:strand:+ start:17793 stop:18548 length:756 start_codon:yes stop_codon:yes gene_type:complete
MISAAERALQDTENGRGFVHPLSETSQKFVQHASTQPYAALDIGAATGVATIPALERGARVIAFDLDHKHLDVLRQEAPDDCRHRLQTMTGCFPEDLSSLQETVGSVLISQVLGFVDGPDICAGFKAIYALMAEGGKLFIVNYTPFISITRDYLPEYWRKRNNHEPWPGHCQDLRQYCDDPELLYNLPNALNLMDEEVLKRELREAGFTIESSRYLGGDCIPEKFRLDGKEWIEVIACKSPSRKETEYDSL